MVDTTFAIVNKMLYFILIEIIDGSNVIILDILVAKVHICFSALSKLVKFLHFVVIFDLDQFVFSIFLFMKNNCSKGANYNEFLIMSYDFLSLLLWKLNGGKAVSWPLLVSLNIKPLLILFDREFYLAEIQALANFIFQQVQRISLISI